MKHIKKITLLVLWILYFPLLSEEKEVIGKIQILEIDRNEILIFEMSNSKYEITGKLTPLLKSFYINQTIKVKGIITNYSDVETKQKKINGKIEIKEVIITKD